MATSKINADTILVRVKRATAGGMPANSSGTFAASVIDIQPDTISGYALYGTFFETSALGCLASYSEDGYVAWQNVTATPQNGVQIIATYLYQKV